MLGVVELDRGFGEEFREGFRRVVERGLGEDLWGCEI